MKTFRDFILECELVEGKVEWDNPKRPLQSGLTPREKNRAKRISTGVENPNKVSFYGKSFDLGDKEYERYGKLKTAHDDEKDKKVPKDKRHQFKQIRNAEGNLAGTKGQYKRRWKDHRNINQPNNPKLYKNDERERNYLLNNLKEPKESFDYSVEEGLQPLPREKMLRKISAKSQAAHSYNTFKNMHREVGSKKSENRMREKVKNTASEIKKMKTKMRNHDPVDSRFKELENRDRGEKK
jgi:hypothetical protein